MRALVTSLGMISALGRGVVPSAAAVRARLSSPTPIDDFLVLGGELGQGVPLRGYPIRDYTEGYHSFGRWIRIGVGCLNDLCAYGKLPDRWDDGFWRKTGLALATPVIDPERFDLDAPLSTADVVRVYGERLVALGEVPIPASNIQVFPMGHAATAGAIQGSLRAFADGMLERVIVLAVDSYVDALSLAWLSEHERLKEPEKAVGMMPGEAGAAFLLETEAAAARRGAAAQAVVSGVALGFEENHRLAGKTSLGMGLAATMAALVPEGEEFEGDVYADLNGEEWRAREFGGALAHVGARLAVTHFRYPATSFGDTGAAAGAASLCFATRMFSRKHSEVARSLVASSSEHGFVGAIEVSSV